jgi:LmbE family N-acetylglucosaminyl deacetylase
LKISREREQLLLKDKTPWLDALKQNVEKQSTEAHKGVALGFADPANTYSEVLVGHTDKTDRSLPSHDEPSAREALLRLFAKDREWQSFFRSCCEMSTYRLIAQAWQFHDELMDRGHPYPPEEVEDALLSLARELLPESVAAHWDAEWAHDLCKDALARLAKHYAMLSAEVKDALDLSGQGVWDERMRSAGLDNNPADFRAALEGWEQAGLEAMKRVGVRGGTA